MQLLEVLWRYWEKASLEAVENWSQVVGPGAEGLMVKGAGMVTGCPCKEDWQGLGGEIKDWGTLQEVALWHEQEYILF